MMFHFHRKTDQQSGLWGLKRNFQLAHQLQKFGFCESEIIPQVVKCKRKVIIQLYAIIILVFITLQGVL